MSAPLAFQTYRCGLAFRSLRYPQMSSTSSCTLPKLPSRTTSRVRSGLKARRGLLGAVTAKRSENCAVDKVLPNRPFIALSEMRHL